MSNPHDSQQPLRRERLLNLADEKRGHPNRLDLPRTEPLPEARHGDELEAPRPAKPR